MLENMRRLHPRGAAVADPRFGYEIHHIIEAQTRSANPLRNSQRFADRIDLSENLVRIPHWKHVEISSWYSRRNDEYGGSSPRTYLRGKNWEEQYEIGFEDEDGFVRYYAARELFGLFPQKCRSIIEANTKGFDALVGDASSFLRAIDKGTYKPE